MTDTYRKNVGIVVFNHENKVLMCARADKASNCWQFPQGGIEKGETIKQAALRELREETGICSVEIVKILPETLRYRFPKNILERRKKAGSGEVGQEQTWVLARFCGEETEINFQTNPEEIEFRAFEWVDIKEAPLKIVEFKKEVYNRVAEAFLPYLQATK